MYNLVNKSNFIHSLFLVYLFIYQSLHFSGDYVPIFRRYNCVYATLCICYCVDDCLVCRVATLHTRQSSTQNNKYQVSHKHSCIS